MDKVRLIDAKAMEDKLIGEAGSIKAKNRFDRGESWGFELAAKMVSRFPSIDPESLRPVSEWELNPNKWTCEWFRCKKCHHISCCTDAYCGGCGAKMKNAGAKSEDLPEPQEEKGESDNEWKEVH